MMHHTRRLSVYRRAFDAAEEQLVRLADASREIGQAGTLHAHDVAESLRAGRHLVSDVAEFRAVVGR